MTIGSLDNFGKSDGENMNPEDFDCSVFFEMYKALFEILDVEVGSFAELLDVYKNVEMDYTLKRHALKQKEIRRKSFTGSIPTGRRNLARKSRPKRTRRNGSGRSLDMTPSLSSSLKSSSSTSEECMKLL